MATFVRYAMGDTPSGTASWSSISDSLSTMSEREFTKVCVGGRVWGRRMGPPLPPIPSHSSQYSPPLPPPTVVHAVLTRARCGCCGYGDPSLNCRCAFGVLPSPTCLLPFFFSLAQFCIDFKILPMKLGRPEVVTLFKKAALAYVPCTRVHV